MDREVLEKGAYVLLRLPSRCYSELFRQVRIARK